MKTFYHSKLTRHLLLVVFTAVAVVFLFSLLLSREYAKEAMNDVNTIANSKMTHIYQNTQFTLDHLRSFGVSMYQDENINTWMVADDNDALDDYAAYSTMRRYQSLQQPFISNIYLINTKARRALDANYGSVNLNEFKDQDMLRSLGQSSPNYASFGSHKHDGITYVSWIFPDWRTKGSFLVVLFDNRELEKFLFQKDNAAGFSIQVVDPNNKLMLGSREGFEGLEQAKEWNEAAGFRQADFVTGGAARRITAADLDMYRWTLYFATDPNELTQNIGAFQRKITLAGILLVAVLLGIIVWGSIRTLSPFRRLAREFQVKLGPQSGSALKEEDDIIRSGLHYLLDSVQQMNTSLRNYKELAKEEYLRQWILQGSDANIRAPLSEISELPAMDQIRMAVIRIESYKSFAEQYNYRSRKLIKYAMGNIASEVAKNQGFKSEAVDMDGDRLVMLFAPNHAEDDDTSSEVMLMAAQEQLSKWLHAPTAVAVSGRIAASGNLRKTYDETYDLTLLKFLTGEAKVFRESDLEESFQSQRTQPDDNLLNELIRAVKQSDHDRMKVQLSLLMDGLKALPLEDLHFQLKMIVYTLFKSFSKVMNLQETAGTDTLLGRFSSLTEVSAWLEEKLSSVMNDQKAKPPASRKDEIAQEIIDFIQNHLQDSMLSLDSISDHLGLSSSYIRHVFKEVYEITLADYILQERIGKVKKLLVSTDHTIAEIAEMAGFQTKSHFYNAFKKSEGVTPVQYRNSEK
ncbi:helix-turn-helix transcriptional regulator [Cohnella suwonensis]|uniref:Helix-turn-helix transcriptional regulator n=1 Tax=Cohnella suwonensis TaxID=696072 RepID=A0ABW0LST2_9BACL